MLNLKENSQEEIFLIGIFVLIVRCCLMFQLPWKSIEHNCEWTSHIFSRLVDQKGVRRYFFWGWKIPSKLENLSRFNNPTMEISRACVENNGKYSEWSVCLTSLCAMKSTVIKFVLNYFPLFSLFCFRLIFCASKLG